MSCKLGLTIVCRHLLLRSECFESCLVRESLRYPLEPLGASAHESLGTSAHFDTYQLKFDGFDGRHAMMQNQFASEGWKNGTVFGMQLNQVIPKSGKSPLLFFAGLITKSTGEIGTTNCRSMANPGKQTCFTSGTQSTGKTGSDLGERCHQHSTAKWSWTRRINQFWMVKSRNSMSHRLLFEIVE